MPRVESVPERLSLAECRLLDAWRTLAEVTRLTSEGPMVAPGLAERVAQLRLKAGRNYILATQNLMAQRTTEGSDDTTPAR